MGNYSAYCSRGLYAVITLKGCYLTQLITKNKTKIELERLLRLKRVLCFLLGDTPTFQAKYEERGFFGVLKLFQNVLKGYFVI